ncbi:hypothetical protein MBH78_13885 [Oceanimonas sp. NS1]|nr:hypothetical protein [Oceanimonas sp. NS1]
MAEVAQALRAGASDYLIKPVGDWTAVKSRLAASLLPAGMREHKELRELASHLEFYRHRDMAATRLLRELGPSGSSTWVTGGCSAGTARPGWLPSRCGWKTICYCWWRSLTPCIRTPPC